MLPTRAVQRTVQASAGDVSLRATAADSAALVVVVAPGFVTARRFVRRGADGAWPAVSIQLAPEATRELAALTIRARRPKVSASDARWASVGTSPLLDLDLLGGVNPADAGDVDAALRFASQLSLDADGSVSWLGLDAASNTNTTLNGSLTENIALPRAIAGGIGGGVGGFDPANGNSSGLAVNANVRAGAVANRGNAYVTMSDPTLSRSDQGLVQQGRNVRVSVGRESELIADRMTYNVAADFSRAPTTIGSFDDALRISMFSSDARVSALDAAARLPALGIPTRINARSRTNTDVRLAGRVDLGDFANRFSVRADSGSRWSLTSLVRRSSSNGANASGFDLAAQRSENTSTGTTLQLNNDRYVGRSGSLALQSSLAWSRSASELSSGDGRPAGAVRFGDGVGQLAFGGAPGLRNESVRNVLDARGALRWHPMGRVDHEFRAAWQAVHDVADAEQSRDDAGRYFYNVVDEIAAGTGRRFDRRWGEASGSARQTALALSLADYYKPSTALDIMSGVRVEARFNNQRAASPADVLERVIERAAPRNASYLLSPRVAFTYRLGNAQGGMASSALGTLNSATGLVYGGAGRFVGFTSSSIAAVADARGGFAGALRELRCNDATVPPFDWTDPIIAADAAPTRCLDGAADLAPDTLRAQTATRPLAVVPINDRITLGWRGKAGVLAVGINAAVTRTSGLLGTVDQNLRATPRQTLAHDGGRAVFVNSIDPLGDLASTRLAESRQNPSFGRLLEYTNDGRQEAAQVTLNSALTDRRYLAGGRAAISYTWSRARELRRGFDRTTGGSPFDAEWQRAALSEHAITLFGGVTPNRSSFALSGTIRLQSGRPFTPIVGTDANGDGLRNDRAFVSPAVLSDASLAESSRRCLERASGEIIGANTCTGPWSVSSNLQLTWFNGSAVGDQRLRASLSVRGPLEFLASSVFNARSPVLSGGYVDPVLYTHGAFDAVTQSYTRIANPNFGNTPLGLNGVGPSAVLDVSISFGASVNAQMARRTVRSDLKGVSVSDNERSLALVSQRLIGRLSNPFEDVLSNGAELALTDEQVRSLTERSRAYVETVDSASRSAAREMLQTIANEPEKAGNARTAFNRAQSGRLTTARRAAVSVLNETQLNTLPVSLLRSLTR